jgi:hypothetical protein
MQGELGRGYATAHGQLSGRQCDKRGIKHDARWGKESLDLLLLVTLWRLKVYTWKSST